MRFPSTGTGENEVHKHKIKGKLCRKVQEHRQLRMLSTQTRENEVPEHKNKCKSGS
jgi:hypothetical protein